MFMSIDLHEENEAEEYKQHGQSGNLFYVIALQNLAYSLVLTCIVL